MKLRYTGLVPVTFMDSRVGEVFPEDEFSVPDEDVESFLVRSDVEVVQEAAVAVRATTTVMPTLSTTHELRPELMSQPAAAIEAAEKPAADEAATDNS